MNNNLVYAWVPGLPHLLRPDLNKSYAELATACQDVGAEFARKGVKRILYYSTQWLSVLGQSVQARPRVSGLHVDENWYEMASLEFDFKLDPALAENLISLSRAEGLQVRPVDYEGFPVDTGTIVANNLLNSSGVGTGMYSCCVYSDYQETIKIGQIMAQAATRLDGLTAIVVVSGLSGRYFTHKIDYQQDAIREERDNQWNRKFLSAMGEGRWNDIETFRADYCGEAKVDMGLKALAILKGAGACEPGRRLVTKAYAPIYGTGAAVLLGV
jgi:2-aminophenol/2-amino-5-chlorophenol 1,6-dioxygenase alpha subunit